jgi:hypothetical protein
MPPYWYDPTHNRPAALSPSPSHPAPITRIHTPPLIQLFPEYALSDADFVWRLQEMQNGPTSAPQAGAAARSRQRLNNLLGEESWQFRPLISFSEGKSPSVHCDEAITRCVVLVKSELAKLIV